MNDELRDFDMNGDEPDPSLDDEGTGGPRWLWIVGVIVVLLILVAFFWSWRSSEDSVIETEAPSAPVASLPEQVPVAATEIVIGEAPGLVESDDWLRGIVAQVSSHPRLAEWLVTPELIRRFVAVVDNVAEGVSPRSHLEVTIPSESFGVSARDSRVYIDRASYDRFDALVDVIESLDTAGTAELYAAVRPLCEQAYQDLGYRGEDFEPTLRRAIRRLLATPVVEGPIEIERKITAYQFADPSLEELSSASKQFLRLGPENLQRLQEKVRALARAIGLAV